MIYTVCVIVIVLVDLFSKYMVSQTMALGSSLPVIENVFHITYARNEGAAFSILQGQTYFLLGFSLAAIILLTGFAYYFRNDRAVLWGSILAIGGAAGNLYDRIFFGYVRDFLDFRIWPIFNVADMAIVSGMFILVFRIIWLETRKAEEDDDE